jgi:hypothetical protein
VRAERKSTRPPGAEVDVAGEAPGVDWSNIGGSPVFIWGGAEMRLTDGELAPDGMDARVVAAWRRRDGEATPPEDLRQPCRAARRDPGKGAGGLRGVNGASR